MRDRRRPVAPILRIALAAVAAVAALVAAAPARAAQAAAAPERPFHERVDLRPLDAVAVFTDGRLKSFGSFASSQMQFVTGPRRIEGQPADFTYLDLLFRPEAYREADVIYVKNKEVRARIADAVRRADPSRAAAVAALESSGLVAESVLAMPAVVTELKAMEGDLIRTEKEVRAIRAALSVKEPS